MGKILLQFEKMHTSFRFFHYEITDLPFEYGINFRYANYKIIGFFLQFATFSPRGTVLSLMGTYARYKIT